MNNSAKKPLTPVCSFRILVVGSSLYRSILASVEARISLYKKSILGESLYVNRTLADATFPEHLKPQDVIRGRQIEQALQLGLEIHNLLQRLVRGTRPGNVEVLHPQVLV